MGYLDEHGCLQPDKYGRWHCEPRIEAHARRLAEDFRIPFEELSVLWSLRYDDEDTWDDELAATRIYHEARCTLGYVPSQWERHRPFCDIDVKFWILARASIATGAPWGGPVGRYVDGVPDDPEERDMFLRIERDAPEEYRREFAVLNRLRPAAMPTGWEGAVRHQSLESLADLEGYIREELAILRFNSIGNKYARADDLAAAHQAWRNAWRIFDALDIVDRPERGEDPGPPFETERRLSELVLWLRKRAVDRAEDGEWIGPKTRTELAKEFRIAEDTFTKWVRAKRIRAKRVGKLFLVNALDMPSAQAIASLGDVRRRSATPQRNLLEVVFA